MSAQDTTVTTSELSPEQAALAASGADAQALAQDANQGQDEANEAAAAEQERNEKGQFKPKNGVQERIDELTRERHEAAREAAYWKGVAEAAKPKAEPVQTEDPSKPKPEQFQSYDEFTEALTDWKIEQREQKRQAKERAEATASTWNQRATAARQAMPDFDAVLSSSSAPMTKAMADVIQDSEKGPDLAYHLAKNPAEAARIAQLSPISAARELGKLEATLSAPKAAPRVTQAPAPVTTVGQGRSTAGDPGAMSMTDYLAWRDTQLKGKR